MTNRFPWLAIFWFTLATMLTSFWSWGRFQKSVERERSAAFQPPLSAITTTDPSQGHPLDPILDRARAIRQRLLNDVSDYTAILVKRERIGGKLANEERFDVKIRHVRQAETNSASLSVYLKFLPPNINAGREVIWVANRDDGKLQTYQFGIPISLLPSSTLAMLGNKYPMSEIGLLRMVDKLIEKGERDRSLGDCLVEIFEHQIVGDRTCQLIQVTHPNRESQFDFHIAQIFIDSELGVPIRYAAYLWPGSAGQAPPLEEEYTYLNLSLNTGLTELDFDPKNASYQFPK